MSKQKVQIKKDLKAATRAKNEYKARKNLAECKEKEALALRDKYKLKLIKLRKDLNEAN